MLKDITNLISLSGHTHPKDDSICELYILITRFYPCRSFFSRRDKDLKQNEECAAYWTSFAAVISLGFLFLVV